MKTVEIKLEDWQQRVVEEREELGKRIKKLDDYLSFMELNQYMEEVDLHSQQEVMKQYYDILCRRIGKFIQF